MHIFRQIFLSNYWWQRSDIWSQASYRYPISWEAFFDPSDSYFLFAEERGYLKWALAHSSSCLYCEQCFFEILNVRNIIKFFFGGEFLSEILQHIAKNVVNAYNDSHPTFIENMAVFLLMLINILSMNFFNSKWNVIHKMTLTADRWFSSDTPISSTDKTFCHDITEILLKVALNTIIQTPNP